MFFRKIKNFIIKNKNILLFLSFLVFSLFPHYTFASEDIGFLDIVNGGVAIVAGFLGLLTQFVAMFMSPEWTSGSFIGFDENLKKLWVMMSNVVYLIFALILIWIALMNILGKGGDWELKSALPKFIGGVLIVPFSWFLVNAMLGFSSIMMTSVITLPYDSFKNDFAKAGEVKICKDFVVNFGNSDFKQAAKCVDGSETTVKQFFEEGKSLSSIIGLYTYGIMNVDALGKLKTADLTTVKGFLDLGVKGVIDLLIIVVYFILMVALMIALFVRGVYIWLFLILSPLFGLMFFFGDKGADGVMKKFSLKEFIALAMVPVYVGAALAFGLLFIFVAGQGLLENKSILAGEDGSDKFKFGEFSLTIKGSVLAQKDEDTPSLSSILTGTQGTISYLIIQILGIAILWMAVMAALKTSAITEQVTKPVADFGDSIGQLAMKVPTYAPIIPSPAGGTMSAQSLGTFGSQMKSNIDSHFSQKGIEASKRFSPGGDTTASDIRALGTKIDKAGDVQVNGPIFKEIIGKEIKDSIDLKALKDSLIKMGIKEESLKGLSRTIVQDPERFAKFLSTSTDQKLQALLAKEGIQRKDDIEKYLKAQGKKSTDSGTTDTGKDGGKTFNIKLESNIKSNKDYYNNDNFTEKGIEVLSKQKSLYDNIDNFDNKDFIKEFSNKIGIKVDEGEKVLEKVKKFIEEEDKKKK